MKTGKSEVIIILDRSGSMSSIKTDMEGGFQTFLAKQKKEPGECLVSLHQFDDVYETVFAAKDIKEVNEIKLEPRNGTALLDAIGKTINAVGARLAATSENERPEVIIVTVITDGQENASKEFSREKVAELVKHQQEKYNWKFVFLGANQDAILVGASYGTSKGLSMTYAATSLGVSMGMQAMCSGVSCLRTSADASYSFTDEQRVAAVSK